MNCCTYHCDGSLGCPVRATPALSSTRVDIALPSDGRTTYALWRYRNSREAGLTRRDSFRKAWRALRRLS